MCLMLTHQTHVGCRVYRHEAVCGKLAQGCDRFRCDRQASKKQKHEQERNKWSAKRESEMCQRSNKQERNKVKKLSPKLYQRSSFLVPSH